MKGAQEFRNLQRYFSKASIVWSTVSDPFDQVRIRAFRINSIGPKIRIFTHIYGICQKRMIDLLCQNGFLANTRPSLDEIFCGTRLIASFPYLRLSPSPKGLILQTVAANEHKK